MHLKQTIGITKKTKININIFFNTNMFFINLSLSIWSLFLKILDSDPLKIEISVYVNRKAISVFWISLPRTDIILLLRAIGHHRQIGLESPGPGKMYLSHLQNLFVETAKCICRNRKMYLSRFQSGIGHHIYADRFGGRQLGGWSLESFLPDAFLFAPADGFLQNKQTLWSASLHFFIT